MIINYGNQKSGAGPRAVTSVGSDTLTYDANGNLIGHSSTGLTRQYRYDAQNRLVEVKHNSAVQTTNVFNDTGTRVKKTAGTTSSIFVGDLFIDSSVDTK